MIELLETDSTKFRTIGVQYYRLDLSYDWSAKYKEDVIEVKAYKLRVIDSNKQDIDDYVVKHLVTHWCYSSVGIGRQRVETNVMYSEEPNESYDYSIFSSHDQWNDYQNVYINACDLKEVLDFGNKLIKRWVKLKGNALLDDNTFPTYDELLVYMKRYNKRLRNKEND